MCLLVTLNSIRFVCVFLPLTSPALSLSHTLVLSFHFDRRHMVLRCCCCCTLIRFCSYVAYILLSRRSVKCVATVKRVAFLSTCMPMEHVQFKPFIGVSIFYLCSIAPSFLSIRVMSVFYASLFRKHLAIHNHGCMGSITSSRLGFPWVLLKARMKLS